MGGLPNPGKMIALALLMVTVLSPLVLRCDASSIMSCFSCPHRRWNVSIQQHNFCSNGSTPGLWDGSWLEDEGSRECNCRYQTTCAQEIVFYKGLIVSMKKECSNFLWTECLERIATNVSVCYKMPYKEYMEERRYFDDNLETCSKNSSWIRNQSSWTETWSRVGIGSGSLRSGWTYQNLTNITNPGQNHTNPQVVQNNTLCIVPPGGGNNNNNNNTTPGVNQNNTRPDGNDTIPGGDFNNTIPDGNGTNPGGDFNGTLPENVFQQYMNLTTEQLEVFATVYYCECWGNNCNGDTIIAQYGPGWRPEDDAPGGWVDIRGTRDNYDPAIWPWP